MDRLPHDVWHRDVLPLLRPADLARLQATSSRLRALIAAAPETAWRAAARNSHGDMPSHPVFAAEGVQAWLRLQADVHRTIAAGGTAVQATSLPEGALSRDLARHAAFLEPGSARLSLLQLPEQGVAASWQLPARAYAPAAAWSWSRGSQHLAIPAAAGWGDDSQLERREPASLVIVHMLQPADRCGGPSQARGRRPSAPGLLAPDPVCAVPLPSWTWTWGCPWCLRWTWQTGGPQTCCSCATGCRRGLQTTTCAGASSTQTASGCAQACSCTGGC